MTRQFAWITATLTGIIGILVGIIVSSPRVPREDARPGAEAAITEPGAAPERASQAPMPVSAASINFADIAAKINPAVVNIDATARSRRARRLMSEGTQPDGDPFDLGRRGGDLPRRGTGTGFLIDAAGHILTTT